MSSLKLINLLINALSSQYRTWLYFTSIMFALILTLNLVAVISGARQPCDENCRIPPPEELQTISRPYCKCLEKYIEWLKSTRLQEKAYKIKRNSMNEPAENQFHHQSINVDYSLSDSILDRTPYYYKNEMTSNISPKWAYQSNTLKVPKSNIPKSFPKIKRKNYDRDITIKTNYPPLYLDIYIKDNDVDQATHIVTDLLETKTKKLIERNFKDCLDLHAIIYSRNSTDSIVESMLSERNKIFNKLPNSDILIEIKKKCNQSANIIAEAMNEIKNSRPFKKSKVMSTSNNEHSFISYGQNGLQEEIKGFLSTKTITERNTPSIEHSTPEIYNEEDYNMERSTTKEFTKDISSIIFAKNLDFMSATFFDNTTDPVTEVGEESSTLGYNQLNVRLDVEDEQNYWLSTNTDISISTSTTVSSINDDDKVTADSIVFKEIGSTELISKFYYEEMKDEITDTTSERNSDNLQNNEISTEHNVLIKLGGINRPSYLEGEYAIPKLETIEFSNETVKSELEGNEEIPNLDFIQTSDDVFIRKEKTDTAKTTISQWDINNQNSKKLSVSENRVNSGKNSTGVINLNMTGELYFKYGSDYVPATFIQKSDGQINVALNIISLCKPNRKDMTKLVQAICNCII